MELIYKAVGAAISTAVIVLLIKRHNPELSTLLSLCAVTVIMLAAVSFSLELRELIRSAARFADTSDIYIVSILKCLAISIVTKLGGELCKDAGQAALSSALEFTGTICAMTVVLPLVRNMLGLIGEMV